MGSLVDPHLDPSGWPLDPGLQVELPVVLEWPGSPAALEDQRNSKKSRSSDFEPNAVTMVEEDMSMDTEVEVGSDDTRDSAPKSGGGAPPQVELPTGKSSYANVVTQGRGRTGYCMGEDVLDPNSVIVLDEDCAGERGKFARLAKPLTPFIGIDNFVQKLEYEGLNQICFSCGKYGHSREVCSLNPVSNDEVAATGVNNNHINAQLNTKSELYGPWMVVKDQRHRSMLSKGSGRPSTDVGGEVTGSRFAVLGDVQDGDRMGADGMVTNQDMTAQLGRPELCGMEDGIIGGVRSEQLLETGSDAYQKSSPVCRSKITGNVISKDSSLNVVPLVGGSSVAVTSHAIDNTSGTHREISIQETGGTGKGSRFDDRHAGRGKGIREVNLKGVRIRKAVGVHPPNRVLLSDWVQTTSNQLQAEVDSNRGRGDVGSVVEEDGREAISPRQLLGSDTIFFGGVSFKDKGSGSGDLPL
ncbi:hypothetical protein V6N11_049973 [Hibiscus sabdariffa]|uniref:CCHC-type domain-containing protein n=1 Tax=Hibiscus sabdariffa TaxID=183260 RepID=A0ABR2T9A5_9ROSI